VKENNKSQCHQRICKAYLNWGLSF